MAFLAIQFVVSVALLLQVDARRISRREEVLHIRGGYRSIDVSEVPQEIQDHAQESTINHLNSDKGIRFFEITSAQKQTVAGTNYKLELALHETECPASASRAAINDVEACPVTDYISCTVVVHQPLFDEALKVSEMSCV